MLTLEEHMLIEMLGNCMNAFTQILGSERTRQYDLVEVSTHIHALQDKVLAQAGARMYPDKYRLLGETVASTNAKITTS